MPSPTLATSPSPASFPTLLPFLNSLSDLFLAPERLSLSVWSERNIILSPEYSARTSNLRLFGWQKPIFDAFTDPTVEEITLCCGVQLVKTLFIQCCLAYIMSEAPGPALLVYPKEEDAKAFSKERLSPMLRDCPVLHGLVPTSDREGNTILVKEFPGGSLSLVGSIAPGNLARRSIRYLFGDEIDKYPLSAGYEGDPMDLARERTSTFGSRRKIVRACSPTISGRSRIQLAYSLSDQRRPFVPCHKCGHMQILRWSQVEWDKSGPSSAHTHHPDTARYICSNLSCRAPWDDRQRWSACQKAEWRPSDPSKPFRGHAGFWISHLYSPWKRLREIVKSFLDSKDQRDKFQVFINTNLAETWEEQGDTPDNEILYGRREPYPFNESAVVPMRGLFLTAAVDVQDNPPRLECEVKAWGRGRENWSIGYWVISEEAANGQPLPVTSPELWDRLDREILQRDFPHESGHTLPILCMGIDTGNKPQPVYAFALRHPRLAYGPAGIRLHAVRTVVPVKGTDDALKVISGISKENAARKRQGIRILSIGTHCIKQELFDALRHIRPKPDSPLQPVPGCCHFPMYDAVYFTGLCSEVKVVHENGRVEYQKRQGPNTRNEPLDAAVYNRAMAAVVGMDRFTEEHWRQMEKQLGIGPALGTTIVAPPAPKPHTGSPSVSPPPPTTALPPERQSDFFPTAPAQSASTSVRGRKLRGRF